MPASPDRTPGLLAERLARAITLAGPMPVSQFMAAANAEYYSTHPSVGADFTTAPEISQIFGELIGVVLAEFWQHFDRFHAHFVEFGPGRGTLAADALRAMCKAGLEPPVHFIETSAILRAEQAKRAPDAVWHDDVSTLPEDAPLLIVANEFFDALPVEQLVRRADGWHQRLVACQDTLFLPVTGKRVPNEVIPQTLVDAPAGSIMETSPASVAIVRQIARRVLAQGGAAIIIDYGYEGPAIGETLQAVRASGFANPFADPGAVDLSAHVDFTTLRAAAIAEGATVHGPISQRDFLGATGIATRAASLARQSPERSDDINAAYQRLTAVDAMGTLFRVMAITAPDSPVPAGFL